jgi:hypothetical protein
MNNSELLPHIKLRFNIEHPSFEECYHYGYKCGEAEISEEENPFHLGSRENDLWQDGWWAGFYGEDPLFHLEESSEAANEDEVPHFISHLVSSNMLVNLLKITGAIAATAVVGYQVFELVA